METVKLILKWFLLIGGMLFWFFVMVGLAIDQEEKVYDCTLAEISPDFPVEVKDACRRIRSAHRRTET